MQKTLIEVEVEGGVYERYEQLGAESGRTAEEVMEEVLRRVAGGGENLR